MLIHADKTPKNKNQSVSNAISQKQGGGASTFQFVDNRSEAVSQKKMQKMISNSSQGKQLKAFQEITINSPRKQELPIQKKEKNIGFPSNFKTDIEKKSLSPLQSSKQQRESLTVVYQQKLINAIDRGSTFQLTENGSWWGSTIGGTLGGIAGAVAGYAYGTLSAATGAITGGVSDAVAGYQHGGLSSALVEGAGGLVTGAFSGMSSGMYHGGSVGMTLGSAIGGVLGDWLTGPEAHIANPDGPIAMRMRANLAKLQELVPLDHAVSAKPNVAAVRARMHPNEIKLLNWMHDALGNADFDKVSRGAQVRIPFHRGLFDRLIALGAQKRPSSHYSGTLFASGFTQIVGEQYGTAGQFLPTVLFGKIKDRKGNFHMYFQPEGNAFNPDTIWAERLRHGKDALNYVVYGVQQGPHGTSLHTDGNPIADHRYTPSLADKTVNRTTDFKAFIANFVYTNGGSTLLSKVGVNSSKGQAMAMELITKLGLYALAYKAWKGFGSSMTEAVWKKVMG